MVSDPQNNPAYPEIEYVVRTRRRNPLERVGCAIGILVWLVVMIIPFTLIVLAVNDEITILHRGDVPEQERYPALQIRLVMEADYRGFNINYATVKRDGDLQTCIQSNAHFLLWEGKGEPATYCDCFVRESVDAPWSLDESQEGQCP